MLWTLYQMHADGFLHFVPFDEWEKIERPPVSILSWAHWNFSIQVALTAKGWNRVEELESGLGNQKPFQAFVAMWFDDVTTEAWNLGLKKGIEDAGYTGIRIDEKPTNEIINDQMLSEIRASKFVVADFTGGREGVYFEAGFALALGKQVIWTCRKDWFNEEKRKVHFDINHYPFILWEEPESLAGDLKWRIGAQIGLGKIPLASTV